MSQDPASRQEEPATQQSSDVTEAYEAYGGPVSHRERLWLRCTQQTERSHRRARQSKAMEAAFFDLDKTVIARSSVLALGKSFYREGMVSLPTLLRSIYAQLLFVALGADEEKMEKARRAATELTKGWSEATVRRLINQTIEDAIRPLIYREALELFDLHRRAGRRIYIVSSAPEEVVEPLARMLKADDFVATRAQTVNGKYTGEIEFYCYGPNKAKAMQEIAQARGIDLSLSYAYSDSITDLPMLDVVGYPHAVNPDRELAKIAFERNWPVLYFEKTVALGSPPQGISQRKLWLAVVAAASLAIAYRLLLKRTVQYLRESEDNNLF
ncbi:MAG: HAD-IB family hydrolase [Acidimicrobiia bacterium]